MKGSGKQILLNILLDLSTRIIDESSLDEASRRLRAGLLLHGSTSDESYDRASRLQWLSHRDDDGDLAWQGVATTEGIFLTDILTSLREAPGARAHILKHYPSLSEASLDAAEWYFWLIMSSVQMFAELNSVEHVGDLDVEGWVESMKGHYDRHFNGNPSDRE